jgi:hippurate hydrolase
MLWLGSVEVSKMKAYTMLGTPLPSMHSPQYAPDREKTLRTGVRALTGIALEPLKR